MELENIISLESYTEKILQLKRVTKVTKGGKKFTYQVLILISDNNNNVGLGIGRAEDVNVALEKAITSGKQHLMSIPVTQAFSIPQCVSSSFGAAKIILLPAKVGTGIIASGALRTLLEYLGIKNIVTKQLGSKNMLNNLKATFLALTRLTNQIQLKANQLLFYKTFYQKYY